MFMVILIVMMMKCGYFFFPGKMCERENEWLGNGDEKNEKGIYGER